MKTLAEGFSLDKARYKLARTTENPMRAIAAELDVRFSEVLDNGEMNHTSVLTLFDRNGTEVTQLHGLGRDSEAFVHRIEAIAGEQL
jgi:cytochrome oxidase Cu insertion factor (SCO1/SenC/PrrC family)